MSFAACNIPSGRSGRSGRVALAGALAGVIGVAGCAMDRAEAVKAEVARYLYPGEVLYFKSDMDCTAAVFKAVSDDVKSSIRLASSVEEAIRLVQRNGTVGFHRFGLSPNEITEQLDTLDRSFALGMVTASVAAKNCMTAEVQQRFFDVLQMPDASIIYDKERRVVIVLDTQRRTILFGRGNL